ncbi:MAG: DUF4332 domain-containing protein [Bacteroidales bacterium]|nr:DUF4332 domain-containing protein [Bacteroidales bacterium]
MGYHINLESITLEDYKTKLETAYLPPSRMLLKDRLEERFGHFRKAGFKNLKELQLALKKKAKLLEMAKTGCLTEEYLVILLREINSMLPKPNKLSEFSGISPESIAKLEKAGIKDTEKLYGKVKTLKNRKELSSATGLSEDIITELAKLSDLSRIKWVGATFARMLYDVGIDTVEKATKADYEDSHEKINRLNRERNIYKGTIGLNDMKIFVNAAKDVILEIEY